MNYELPGDYRGGHFSTFPALSPEYTPEDFEGSLFEARDDNVIKFQALHMPPYIITKTSGNESFTAFGPLYSIIHEVGKRINFSMKGDNIDMVSGGVSWERAIAFAPDILIAPMTPNLDAMLSALDFGFAEFTRCLGSVEGDHILAKREYTNSSVFAIFTAFDPYIWFGILLTLLTSITITFISKYLLNRLRKNTFKNGAWYFFLLTSLFGAPCFLKNRYKVWLIISLFYTFYAFFLETIISGDLVTVLTLGAQPNSIDTFEKLATRNTYIPLVTYGPLNDDAEAARLMYFKPGFPFRKDLTKRLKVLPLETQLDFKVASQMLYEVSLGQRIQLGQDVAMRYCINHWFNGNYSDVINYSEDFGFTMPGFMMQLLLSNPKFKTAIQFVILQLLESGIFNKWLEYHIGDSKFINKKFHGDTATTSKNLSLPSLIIIYGLWFSGVLIIVEIVVAKCKRKKTSKVQPRVRCHSAPIKTESLNNYTKLPQITKDKHKLDINLPNVDIQKPKTAHKKDEPIRITLESTKKSNEAKLIALKTVTVAAEMHCKASTSKSVVKMKKD